jgi:hypothetical protein
LVAFGEDVILFSDKRRDLRLDCDTELQWRRWQNKIVHASVRSLKGAEDFLRNGKGEIYEDATCSKVLNLDREWLRNARIHKVAICEGAEKYVSTHIGGIGTLMLQSGTEEAGPFTLSQTYGEDFVHVIDGVAARLLLTHLDTAWDFVNYLKEREDFYRCTTVLMPGEDEALAMYITTPGFPSTFEGKPLSQFNAISFVQGYASNLLSSGKYDLWIEENRQSYILDEIIEKFRFHFENGTSLYRERDFPSSTVKSAYEHIAATARVERRMIVGLLSDMALDPGHIKAGYIRRAIVKLEKHPGHSIVLLVMDPHFDWDDERYRVNRRHMLQMLVGIAKHMQGPGVVSGFAMNSAHLSHSSEDFMYVDDSMWTEEQANEARRAQEAWNIWKGDKWNAQSFNTLEKTPDIIRPTVMVEVDRTKVEAWVAEAQSRETPETVGTGD